MVGEHADKLCGPVIKTVYGTDNYEHLCLMIHRNSGINAKPSRKPRRNAVML